MGTDTYSESKFLDYLIESGLITEEDIDKTLKTIDVNGIEVSYYTEEYGAWSETNEINMPQIDDGMIPIKWDSNNLTWVICSQDDEDWYDYDDKDWANIMLSDGTYDETAEVGQTVATGDLGSMFVWIPRYAYSIKEYQTSVISGEGTTQEIFDITFLVGTSNKDKNGNSYATDYSYDSVAVGDSTPMIVHFAFEFDNSQISGFWSAKFEASMAETNSNDSTNNTLTPTVKVVPNAETWRYINIGNSFGNCIEMNDDGNIYAITTDTESMLMQNAQWGAIAYLTTSVYGFTPVINNSYTYENPVYHSWAAGDDYITNVNQSTTGNITGIYDMNGGASERTASYWATGRSEITTYGTTIYFDSSTKEIKPEYTKYWEEYIPGTIELESVDNGLWDENYTYNNTRMLIADERYSIMKYFKGDAMYEIIKEGSYSYYGRAIDGTTNGTYAWIKDKAATSVQYGTGYYNGDYVLIGNILQSFVYRGGYWYSDTYAGVFASKFSTGDTSYNDSFRPVLVCE